MVLSATCATRDPSSPHQPQSRYLELSPFGNRRLRGVQVTRARPRPTHRPARAPQAGCVRVPGRPPRPLGGPEARRRARPRPAEPGVPAVPESSFFGACLLHVEQRGVWNYQKGPVLRGGAGRQFLEERGAVGGRGYFGHSGGRPALASGKPASLGSVGAASLVTGSGKG